MGKIWFKTLTVLVLCGCGGTMPNNNSLSDEEFYKKNGYSREFATGAIPSTKDSLALFEEPTYYEKCGYSKYLPTTPTIEANEGACYKLPFLNTFQEVYLIRVRTPPKASVNVLSDYVFLLQPRDSVWRIDFSLQMLMSDSWDRRTQYKKTDMDSICRYLDGEMRVGTIFPKTLKLPDAFVSNLKRQIADSLFWATNIPPDIERLNRDYWAWEIRGYKNGVFKRICDTSDEKIEKLIRPYLLKMAKTAKLKDRDVLHALDPKNLYEGEKYRNFGL